MNTRAVAALISVCLLIPVSVAASTMLALDLTALARAADEIVVVEVLGLHAEPARGAIVTRVIVQVERPVAGRSAAGDDLEVIVPGGELDGLGMLVHGAPQLVPGERYLLFLRRVAPEYHVVGLSQGAMPVRRSAGTGEALVSTPTNLPGLVRQVDGRLESALPAIVRPTPLEQVIVRIEEARHGHE